jgi:mRNA interferase MazF
MDSMIHRGDFVTIAMQGDFGKPRPALVIQSDSFNQHDTVTVLLVTSALVDAPLLRISVAPAQTNGLQKPSQVMIDKAMTVKRDKLGAPFGTVNDATMLEISRCLAVFLGIAS